MNYPFWDVDIGYGWLMATIAVFHVFISHFAIGGGLYLVITETLARKAGDTIRLAYLEKVSRFFVLTTLVLGALTGVGIWFIIGLLNPAATEALIHHFVWAWATEWTFFIIEIAAALIYLYSWKTMSAKNHLVIGWIYFIAAWLSLFVINGIISFMLTPGDWLTTGNVWDGLFNPTFWSSLVLRTGVCIMLAGVFTMMTATKMVEEKSRGSLIRYNAVWGIVGLAITLACMPWFKSSIPQEIITNINNAMPTVGHFWQATYWWAYVLGGLIIIFGFILPKKTPLIVTILIMIIGLVWFGQFEFFREAARKPYAIYGYMYGNGIDLSKADSYAQAGLLPSMAFRTGDDGADLFRHYCRSCHTVDGYKPLNKTFDGTDQEFIKQMTIGMIAMRGNMPPWLGTEDEADMLAAHLYAQVDQRPFEQVYPLTGVELGKKVYEIRCGRCHVLGGFNDKTASLAGMERTDYEDIIESAGDFADEMPDFTGNDTEREALIQFLLTLKQPEVK